ncbi:MAG: hypothetical protein HPY89_08255 [Pelotomaculum sp.]|nr:hypothetical protein [Pelotomaculum sp.]
MTGKFWENETPETIEGKYLDWKYFPIAGKLQVIRKRMTEMGVRYMTTTIDVRDVTPDVRKMLKKFIGE